MKAADVRTRFVELRALGWSFSRIACELKVAKSTLLQWSKDLAEDVSNMRAIESDALIEAHKMGREHRLQLLGAVLGKVRTQLAGRSFDEMATDRLVELALKLNACIEVATMPPQFSETRYKTDGDLSSDSIFTKQVERWTA
jgi:orotate phosphoribosyltransferase-like protein